MTKIILHVILLATGDHSV